MKLKNWAAAALSAAMLLALTACGNTVSIPSVSSDTQNGAGEKEKITFVLDWTPNTNHTGLYVAREKGYFADAGLEVEIVQPPEDGAEMLVGSGKAQFGVSFQDTLAPALVGDDAIPVTAVASLVQHNTSGILSRAGEGMDTPKGLEGHKYATWDLPVEQAVLKNVMKVDGGDFSKVNLVPSTVTDEVSALKGRSVDAIWVFYAWGGMACKTAGLDTDYFAFQDINPVFDYYTPVIIGNNDYLAQHPDTAKAFLSALAKGYRYAIDNPEDAANILLTQCPELESSRDLVVASQKYLAEEYVADAPRWGEFNAQRWNAFYGWLNENNLVSPQIPENTGFTNDYLPTA